MPETTVLEPNPNLLTHMTETEMDDLSNRGLAIYAKLKPVLEPEFDKKFIAIHVDTEDYEVAISTGNAMRVMRKRHPVGRLVMMKIGDEPEWGLAARFLTGQMMVGRMK